jgi:hypothetical protein
VNNRINYLLSFAKISDEFSGRNSYENLIKILESNKSKYSENEFNKIYDENISDEYKALLSNISTLETLSIRKDNDHIDDLKLNDYLSSHIEYKNLIKNIQNKNKVIVSLNQLIILKCIQDEIFETGRDSVSTELELYCKTDIESNKIYMPVISNIPLKSKNVEQDEIDKISMFYESYPSLFSLKNGENIKSAIQSSVGDINKVADTFLSSVIKKEGKSGNMKDYPLYDKNIMKDLVVDPQMKEKIATEVGVINHLGKKLIDQQTEIPQLYNIAVLDIIAVLKIIKNS